jgi:RAD51-like protein 2
MLLGRGIVSCKEIAPSVRLRLIQKGYRTVDDVLSVAIHDLSRELELSVHEVASLIRLLTTSMKYEDTIYPVTCSAAELLEKEHKVEWISTSSSALDHLLGGGIPLNKVTELCGFPGTGKTQLAMQLTANVIVSMESSSWVIYIDSEGGFSPERLMAMMQSSSLSIEKSLKQVIYLRVVTKKELIAALYYSMNLIGKHPVRLVIIDSIAFLLRYDGAVANQERVRLSNHISQLLTQMMTLRENMAVILTNHLTLCYTMTSEGRKSLDIPALSKLMIR